RLGMVETMVADGRLSVLKLPRPGPSADHAYWLIRAEADPKPEVLEVMAWIRDEAAACVG
ncbi:MAG TPA: hypothetical protein VFF03_00070, partial [Rhodocyclaceae bacterium]|nr:hypothetical protein [Rhodocyclaceae bacterium]